MRAEDVAVFLGQDVVMGSGGNSIIGRLVSLHVDESAAPAPAWLVIIAVVDYGFGTDITQPGFSIRRAVTHEVDDTSPAHLE